jgi:hypothetical protein
MLSESVPQLKMSLAKNLEKLGAANPGKVSQYRLSNEIFYMFGSYFFQVIAKEIQRLNFFHLHLHI